MPETMVVLPFQTAHRGLHVLGYVPTAVETNAEASPATLHALKDFGRAEGMTDIAISRQDPMGEILLVRPKALADRIKEIVRDVDRDWTGEEMAQRIENTFVLAEDFARRVQRKAAARTLTRRAYDTYLRWLITMGEMRRRMMTYLDEHPEVITEAARRAGRNALDFKAALEKPFAQVTIQRGALLGQAGPLPAPVAWGIVKLVLAGFALAALALVVKLAAIIGHHMTVVTEHELSMVERGAATPEDIARMRRQREGIPWELGLVVVGALGVGYLLVQWQKGRGGAVSEAA